MNLDSLCRNAPAIILSSVIVTMTLGVEGYGLFYGFSDKVNDVVLGRILGTLDTSMAIVLAYWFSSTKGSHEKDATIANLTVKP